ncbi:VOC family protein [Amycolatopsis jejuensis]|uniref:VOC family protein n=1 Tax=Amycolatopsis jejuensis TaxID=330084 RepID=UPI00068A72CB|nr:VOC family protein [Amycolatopsis jejuensis]
MDAKKPVSSLGYTVITAEDLPAWQSFAESVLGLQVNAGMTTDSELYFRVDDWGWRFAVEQGTNGGLAALGFEVHGSDAFAELQEQLTAAGFPVKHDPELAKRRRVLDLFRTEDPDGNPLEFFYGGTRVREPFVSAQGARFVTGSQGLGHVVLWVGDVQKTEEFYLNTLGFRLSDVFSAGPMTLYFTSPNARHHSVAYGNMPGVPSGVQHILLEVDDIDAVGRALDRVHDAGIPLAASLGRHTNDRMLSFYCISPSGLAIEYGFGGRVIDDERHTTDFYAEASTWGHRFPDGTDPQAQLEPGDALRG